MNKTLIERNLVMGARFGGKEILFVSTKESFIMNGLIKKLHEEGMQTLHVFGMKEVHAGFDDHVKVVIYYMDEDAENVTSLHTELFSKCKEFDKRLICIATREQYECLLKNFPAGRVAKFFERPLDMQQFIRAVSDETKEAKESERFRSEKLRVMIVDDDSNYRQIVREWLKPYYNVVMANGGTQAITLLATQRCDVILLDFEMPIVAGPQVMEMIRENPDNQKIPIIFLTGKNDVASIKEVLALHPAGYLLKSVTAQDLLIKVAEVLAKSEA